MPCLATIFAAGFLALFGQTVVFRAFSRVFESGDLGTCLFFGTWLLWVAVGAALGRLFVRLASRLAPWLAAAPLFYLPALVLQVGLIERARQLYGVAAYELFPLDRLLPAILWLNAPTSLLTGLLFPILCDWARRRHNLPVARVYATETIGAFAGGALATATLGLGCDDRLPLLVPLLAIAAAAWPATANRRRRPADNQPDGPETAVGNLARRLALAVAMLSFAALAGHQLAPARQARQAWNRLLPNDAYRGTFQTTRTRYSHGEADGQFIVVANQSVLETLPDPETAWATVAAIVAQHPSATRVLLVDDGGLALVQALADLPGMGTIAWLCADPDYPSRLLARLPAAYGARPANLLLPGQDPRHFLRHTNQRFDLVVVAAAADPTAGGGRWVTQEFMGSIRQVLSAGGVVAVHVPGAANYPTDEGAAIGAATLAAIGRHFPSTAILPGEATWLFGATAPGILSEDGGELASRWRQRFDGPPPYPAEALLDVVNPWRLASLRQAFEQASQAIPAGKLAASDEFPRLLRHALVANAALSGHDALPRRLFEFGPRILAALLLALLLARLAMASAGIGSCGLRKQATGGPLVAGGAGTAVFAAAAAGMVSSLMLMYRLEMAHGSLYLQVGLVSSLFMVGAWGGCRAGEWLAAAQGARLWQRTVAAALQVAFLLGLARLAATSRPVIALFFLAAGLLAGFPVAIAAGQLEAVGRSAHASGTLVELFDHAGGAVGGLAAGLLLLPLAGVGGTLAVAALLPAIVAGESLLRQLRWRLTSRIVGPLAAILILTVGATIVHAAAAEPPPAPPPESRRDVHVKLADGAEFVYQIVERPDHPALYVFPTARLAPGIRGYGGPIELEIGVDATGSLRHLRVVANRETPAFFRKLAPWLPKLLGRQAATVAPGKVDAVSGATVSSTAILAIVQQATDAFQKLVPEAWPPATPPLPELDEAEPPAVGHPKIGPPLEPAGWRPPPAGQSRRLDPARIRNRIEAETLSDHPARWVAPPDPSAP